jgi:hypothetical protein
LSEIDVGEIKLYDKREIPLKNSLGPKLFNRKH